VSGNCAIHDPQHSCPPVAQPGELADFTNALSLAGVNIRSLAAMSLGNQALLRLIPDDVDAARNALCDRNIAFEENEVATVLLEK
jgi:hypothetical protein